jgi:hypothetical protein
MKKKSTKLKQNKVPGMRENKKVTKNKAILETMALMNMEIDKLTTEMRTMMNFNATILEVAEINGLFLTQDVLQLMEANVKNSSVYQMTMNVLKDKPTKNIDEISFILGEQMFDHKLTSTEIRKDIINFDDLCPPEEVATLIEKAEEYRKDIETRIEKEKGDVTEK